MNIRSIIAAFAVLAMGTPAIAMDAMTAPGPVKVTSCIVASSVVNSVLVQGVSRTNGVTVAFANTSQKTATAVTIHGSYNGINVTDTLKGSFAAGKSYQMTKTYVPTIYVGPNASCHVTHVTFADGTSWGMGGAGAMSQ